MVARAAKAGMGVSMNLLLPVLCGLALVLPAAAIPNSIFGPIAQAESPLNGRDLTDTLVGDDLWAGSQALPGRWQDEASVPGTRSSHLVARPKVFGREAALVRVLKRGEDLEEIQVTFADAGSYFGYFDDKLPDGLFGAAPVPPSPLSTVMKSGADSMPRRLISTNSSSSQP